MKNVLLVCTFIFLSTAANAQVYKCTVSGATVIQDSPCPPRATSSTAVQIDPAPSGIQDSGSKLAQDQAYIAGRVKARQEEREKNTAKMDIARCDAQAASLLDQVNKLAATSPTGQPVNLASAAALQLDQQRRQTRMQSLQAQHTAKLSQCDQMRQAFRDKYGP